jgi:hypothetical protein
MRRTFFITLTVLITVGVLFGEVVDFSSNWGSDPLFNKVYETTGGLEIIFSMHQMVVEDTEIDGVEMKTFGVPSIFLPAEGAPNLTGANRYVAIPQGASVRVTIIGSRTEVYQDVEVAPASNYPAETDDSPLVYEKDMGIYGVNAYYPSSPVKVSEPSKIRGVDVVKVGVIPFQYNPVTKELIVYKDIRFRIDFIGGNGHFGEDRLRSRFWDPILRGHLLNYGSLPEIDYYSRTPGRQEAEYVIIVPDDADFIQWADTIMAWRKLQGIYTEVFTLTDVGGSSSGAIESFLNNAYNTWIMPPAAFLLLSDYPSSGDLYGITSPMWSGYCVSDNIYADVDGDDLPDMHHARITAQDYNDLETMINKFLSYERAPYTDPGYYDNPLIACGWQDGRWFQLCTETVYQFMLQEFGKSPVHQYNVYSGNPYAGCPWTTRTGSTPVIQYWYNVGWLTQTTNPYNNAWWNNGSASGINSAINSGAFFLQHRDHGNWDGWGEPDYDIYDLNGLTNNEFVFVFSINCLTGMYDYSSEVFSEKFHRIDYGALGVNAASEVSYSFVNDTYIWGIYDGMYSGFDPNYPVGEMTGYDNWRPCQAMSSGKIYLDAMWFPDSVGAGSYRDYTYHLFHHHGDAFITLYSEIPMTLSVSHPATVNDGVTSFPITANDSSIIGLTVDGEIIGVAEGTGSSINITIPAQYVPDTIKVTVTKANYYRYEADVPIVAGTLPFIGHLKSTIDDVSGGNGDGLANPGETINFPTWVNNIGGATANGVYGFLSETDPYVSVSQDSSYFGSIPVGDSALGNPDYVFDITQNAPDLHEIQFNLTTYDQAGSSWVAPITVTVYAPDVVYENHTIDDAGGSNPNGLLDPGETADILVTLKNDGHQDASNVTATLLTSDTYITINDNTGAYGNINQGSSVTNTSDPFTVTASPSTPQGHIASFTVAIAGDYGFVDTTYFDVDVGMPGVPYADHNIGNVIFTVTSRGACGFMDDGQTQGSGFIYPFSGSNSLFIGSVWVGNASNYVVNADYSAEGSPDWEVSTSPDGLVRMGGTYYSNQDGWAMYTDAGMSAPKDIYVTQNSWAWANHPYDDFVIMVYTVENKGSSAANGVYVGHFMDVDITAYYDYGAVNSGMRMAYIYEPGGIYVGTKLLEPTTATNLFILENATYVYPNSYILDSDKISMLNGSITNTAGSDDDWSSMVSAGPYNINPGECIQVAFAIIGGSSQGDLEQNGDTAQYKYDSMFVGVEEPTYEILPKRYYLSGAYPNPVSNGAMISYQLPRKSEVSLCVYDVSGRLVDILVDGVIEAGYHSLRLDTKPYASGIYFYRLTAGSETFTRKLIVVK